MNSVLAGSVWFNHLPNLLRLLQGTTVFPLLMSCLYDENEWEKPYSFYPPHFLDKGGKFIKRDAFIPFSAGLYFNSNPLRLNILVK